MLTVLEIEKKTFPQFSKLKIHGDESSHFIEGWLLPRESNVCVFAFLLPFIVIPSVAYFQRNPKSKGKRNIQPLKLWMHFPLPDAAIVPSIVMLILIQLQFL